MSGWGHYVVFEEDTKCLSKSEKNFPSLYHVSKPIKRLFMHSVVQSLNWWMVNEMSQFQQLIKISEVLI